MKAALIDIAGVLTDQGAAIEGSADAIRRLRARDVPFRLITNTTRRPKRRLIADLASSGFDVAPELVFTPAQVAIDHLRQRGLAPHLLIHPDLEEDFADCAHAGRPAVIIGDAGRYFDYTRLNAAFRLINAGAEFLALAANRTFRDSDGQLSMDAGAFVHALEYSSGRAPTILGKPSPAFFETAARDLGCPMSQVAMIGDDAEADVAGSLAAGLGRAYLVRTGKYADGDADRFDPPPSANVADLAEAVSDMLG